MPRGEKVESISWTRILTGLGEEQVQTESSIYNAHDVTTIVSASDAVFRPTANGLCAPLLSPTTGQPYPARSFGALLDSVVSDILMGRISLDCLGEGITSALGMAAECRFMQLGASSSTDNIMIAVKSAMPRLHLTQEDLVAWSSKATLDTGSAPSSLKESKLAVVGMSCRLPGGANNHELFWKLLMERRDLHTRVPSDRFDLAAHFDPTGKTHNTTQTPFGCFIDKPGMFDAGFFNMSPVEVSLAT